jgi:outer membrane protein OmpA-like peptidoglycan-associated protein
VLAYAAGDEDQSSHARGVSLARALAVRDYLSDQGIGMDRLDIRALGNTAQEEPADRVDLIPLAQ